MGILPHIGLHNKMSKQAELNIIVAVDNNYGYGKNGEIPWKLEHEFGYFLKMIENKAIILGKNCWVNDLKCVPFPTCYTAIVSTSLPHEAHQTNSDNASMDEAIVACQKRGFEHIFIGGGRSVYDAALKDQRMQKVYMTRVDGDFNCDAVFPHETMKNEGFSRSDDVDRARNEVYREFSSKNPHKDPNCGVEYSFTCYMRKFSKL